MASHPLYVFWANFHSLSSFILQFTRSPPLFFTISIKQWRARIKGREGGNWGRGRNGEIKGRVREGTGKAFDTDKYDEYYNQLFIWNSKRKQIIGAYRIGFGNRIIESYGKKGFYSTSLFQMDNELIPYLEQSIELGRSFVTKEYQQKPLPLFLLWQAICKILISDKNIKYIIGPVSISNNFSRFSKELLIAFIRKHHFNNNLAQYITPKKYVTPGRNKIN